MKRSEIVDTVARFHQQARSEGLFFQEIEAEVKLVERAQPEQIDLEQAELLETVLVPLDHRAVRHRGVLDGDQTAHGFVPEQESSGVDGQMARKVDDLARQP